MAEEIDLEKCNFLNFRSSVTLTLDRVEVTLVRISGRGLPTHHIRSKSEKLFVDVWMDVRMDGHIWVIRSWQWSKNPIRWQIYLQHRSVNASRKSISVHPCYLLKLYTKKQMPASVESHLRHQWRPIWIIPATSVAASIGVDLCLKAVMTSLRSTWLMSPCRRPTKHRRKHITDASISQTQAHHAC